VGRLPSPISIRIFLFHADSASRIIPASHLPDGNNRMTHAKKGSRGAKRYHQEALFDDGVPANASALVEVAPDAGPLSAAQRTFNRLTARIRRGRESLAAWEAFIPRFRGRVIAELQPVEHKLHDAQRRLVRQLAALLAGPGDGKRLTRKHGTRVRVALVDVIENLLQAGPDPELEALHDRYSDVSHAEQRQQEMEAAEALLDDMFGAKATQGHEAQDVEELLHHATEKILGDEARRRNRTAARKEKVAPEASQTVREVYRKLASALHPDRETDGAERERKTALMQRANLAYTHNDLLELLSLQIETEQIDASALSRVPEARLRHYNQVLQEQAQALEAQIGEHTGFFRMELDLTTRNVTPQHVDELLSTQIVQVRAAVNEIEDDLKRLADPRQRRSVLDALPDPEPDMPDFDDIAALAAMFGARFQPVRPATPKRKRGQKRGKR